MLQHVIKRKQNLYELKKIYIVHNFYGCKCIKMTYE